MEPHLTVGELKRWIKDFNIPDDAKVLYQRIEDVYFNEHGWDKVTLKKPDYEGEPGSEYVCVENIVKYPNDDNLYLDAHY